MKDARDLFTVDAFAPRPRGRPRTGKALSASERKRAQRSRDRDQVFSSRSNLCDVTVNGLAENLVMCVRNGWTALGTEIAGELLRRAELNEGPGKS